MVYPAVTASVPTSLAVGQIDRSVRLVCILNCDA
jgi:hypothetical protein